MSENIPESIPTSHDKRSQRPIKKRALSPASKQSSAIDALFANADRADTPSGTKKHTLAAPPEIVANVQGSSAGAGSGEFHVYKASRRREYERLKLMDEEKEKEEADKRFEAEREEAKRRDEEKTGKNRARREKAKMRKEKAKKGGDVESGGDAAAGGAHGGTGKVKLKANVPVAANEVNGNGTKEEDRDMEGIRNGDEIGIIIHDDD